MARSLLVTDAGEELIEHGLLASLNAIAVIGVVITLGSTLHTYSQAIAGPVRRGS
jgi:Flp pilus assembly pilin Flp